MVIINTIGGDVYEFEGDFEEATCALCSPDCHYFACVNENGGRAIVPCDKVSSIEEVNVDYQRTQNSE